MDHMNMNSVDVDSTKELARVIEQCQFERFYYHVQVTGNAWIVRFWE